MGGEGEERFGEFFAECTCLMLSDGIITAMRMMIMATVALGMFSYI